MSSDVTVTPGDHEPTNIMKMLAELRAEREAIEESILVLERIGLWSEPLRTVS
jgi:hypothetical protein